MYDRKTVQQTVTLQVSGMLWQRSLVMRDLETGSLWSHLLGKSMQGKLKGIQLKMLPAAITTWSDWKTRHPQTTLLALPRTAQRFRENIWNTPKRFVYGIQLGAGQPAPAIAIALLQEKHFHQIKAGNQAILVTYSHNGNRVQAFDCELDGTTYHFTSRAKGLLTDQASRSYWDPVTGKCVEGKLQGKQLKPIPGTISYRKAWVTFYPEEKIIE